MPEGVANQNEPVVAANTGVSSGTSATLAAVLALDTSDGGTTAVPGIKVSEAMPIHILYVFDFQAFENLVPTVTTISVNKINGCCPMPIP